MTDRVRALAARLLRRRETGLAVFVLLVVALVSAVDQRFLTWNNLNDLLVRAAPTTIVACGVMLVVVTAEIDISVGSLMAVLAALFGLMVSENEWQWPLWVGIPLTLAAGIAVGLITGCLVAYGRVPSIIVTLGLLTALRGVATLIMGGENIDGLPAGLGQLCKVGVWGLPLGVWTAAAVVGVTGLLIAHVPLGRRLFAVGSSRHSARMAGLSEQRLKLFVFAYTGLLTAVATIVDVPRLPKIEAGLGSELELLVVTCVVVGGVSIAGGRGTLTGVLLAIGLMTLVRPVLTFLDVGESGEKWAKAIQGLFILVAVLSDRLAARWHAAPSPPLPRQQSRQYGPAAPE